MEILLLAALLGLIPAAIARSKGRNFGPWWLYGAALFIFALPHSILLKSDPRALEKRQLDEGGKKGPHCAEIVKAEARVCRYCGREVPAATPVAAPPLTNSRASVLRNTFTLGRADAIAAALIVVFLVMATLFLSQQ